MKQKQKGSSNVFMVLVIVLLAIAGFALLKGKAAPTETGTSANQAIQSDSDLQNASQDLDNTNIDGVIDPVLEQNTTDSQTFAPRIRLKNGTSSNWSGYAVETNLSNPQSNAVSDVKGQWTVPAVNCSGTTTNTYSALWIGIDGYSDSSVEQTGTEQDCINGIASYSAWYEMYPKPSFRVNIAVKAGDIVSARVQYVGNKFVLTLNNVTTGKTFTTSQKSNAQRQSAEWIAEAPWSGGVLPLANFGTMLFSNAGATLNGHAGTISDGAWKNDQIIMANSLGIAKATPSSLSLDGSRFSITWHSP